MHTKIFKKTDEAQCRFLSWDDEEIELKKINKTKEN